MVSRSLTGLGKTADSFLLCAVALKGTALISGFTHLQISIGGWIREDVMCEQPAVYVFNTTSLEWVTDYQAHTTYSTPLLLANLTGGTGTSNTSTGGSGWTGQNNNYTATVTKEGASATSTPTTSQDPSLQEHHSSSKLGPM